MVYHAYTFLQNAGMLIYWYFKHYSDPLQPDWYGFMLISMVIGGTLVGSLLTLLYYKYVNLIADLMQVFFFSKRARSHNKLSLRR